MKKILLLPILFLSFLSPLNSEIKEKKEYGKYDFYAKCLDDALPKTLNTGIVYECSKKANEKIRFMVFFFNKFISLLFRFQESYLTILTYLF